MAALLDAAEKLMLEEGYAAVTSRRVAAAAGLKPQLVHYYFRTMDDLFLALFRRRAEQGLERQAQAAASDQPLWALWDLSRDPRGTALTMEFIALANHRKAILAEIAASAERFRAERSRAFEAAARPLRRSTRSSTRRWSAPCSDEHLHSSSSSSRRCLGMSTGHAETVAFVEDVVDAGSKDRDPAAGETPANGSAAVS